LLSFADGGFSKLALEPRRSQPEELSAFVKEWLEG
jgi:hypothetical protein